MSASTIPSFAPSAQFRLTCADEFDAALTLVNWSRQGTNTPRMTPAQGLNCLRQQSAQAAEDDTKDRLQVIIDDVYRKYTRPGKSIYSVSPPQHPKQTFQLGAPKRFGLFIEPFASETEFDDEISNSGASSKRASTMALPPTPDASQSTTPERSANPRKRSAYDAKLDDNTNDDGMTTKKTTVRRSANKRTKKTPAIESDNIDKTEDPKTKHKRRSKSNPKTRGLLEAYGRALKDTLSKHDDPDQQLERIPDYSAQFSDPRERIIMDNVFPAEPNDNAATPSRYVAIKRRCLFAAALLYERNCAAKQLGKDDKGDNKLYDINTTRMQPAALIDVNHIRPMFSAYRPANDPTFALTMKPKDTKKDIEKDPEAQAKEIKDKAKGIKDKTVDAAVKGQLADLGWFPKMIEKRGSTVEIINADWYENLGTKKERQKWLAIVEAGAVAYLNAAEAAEEEEVEEPADVEEETKNKGGKKKAWSLKDA